MIEMRIPQSLCNQILSIPDDPAFLAGGGKVPPALEYDGCSVPIQVGGLDWLDLFVDPNMDVSPAWALQTLYVTAAVSWVVGLKGEGAKTFGDTVSSYGDVLYDKVREHPNTQALAQAISGRYPRAFTEEACLSWLHAIIAEQLYAALVMRAITHATQYGPLETVVHVYQSRLLVLGWDDETAGVVAFDPRQTPI